MINDDGSVSRLLPEPADGSMLVVDDGDGERTVIWRDDAEAKRWGGMPGERWFSDRNCDPMSLYQHVKYAAKVYEVAGKPVAMFGN